MSSRILIVDDDRFILKVLKDEFSKEPYDVVTAESAEDGLEIMAMTPVHVVISDELMPGMTGTEFLCRVRRKYPDTVRIILTAHANLETAISSINEAEIHRFFTKPFNPLDMIVAVRLALQNKELNRDAERNNGLTKKQSAMMEKMESLYPGISNVKRNAAGEVVIDEEIDDEIWDQILNKWTFRGASAEQSNEC